MTDRKQVVEHLRSTFGDRLQRLRMPEAEPPGQPAPPRVETQTGTHLPQNAQLREVAEGAAGARRDVLAAASGALAKVEDGREDQLSPTEQVALEAIILVQGRPPLFVQGGDFQEPPPLWAVLEQHRAAIRSSIARVGRIEVAGHPDFTWLGTGFLAGQNAIITNRHVALEFAAADGARWNFRSGMSARLDLNEEHGALDPVEFEVTGILGIHSDHDLAVLSVAPAGGAGTLPEPLVIAREQPGAVVQRQVYVIGYPAWDGRRNDPDYMAQIFRNVYNVKRLQPGLITQWPNGAAEFQHDCSTLGGNSGSPVFDLETHTVVGLHFGGRYLITNHAVALWRLAGDPLLVAAGVNFG
ncbi:MAG TPA: serine protease [Actinoplanes sp.]|nr:serine protease [Actinoplanes sp.]